MVNRSGTRAEAKLVALCKRTYPWICHLCGNPIPRVQAGHPQSYEADHVQTYAHAPHLRLDIRNLRPAHKCCNQWRRTRPVTPELKQMIMARYAARYLEQPRPALAWFLDHDQGGGSATG